MTNVVVDAGLGSNDGCVFPRRQAYVMKESVSFSTKNARGFADKYAPATSEKGFDSGLGDT